MDYQLVLAPDLGITPHDFVMAWNADSKTCEIAEAHLVDIPPRGFDPSVYEGIVALGHMVAVGLATNGLYELIKSFLVRQGIQKTTTITRMTLPGNTQIEVITISEEDC